jgi:hypothetical protein
MDADALERLRAVNPVPDTPVPPAVGQMRARLEARRPARGRFQRRRWLFALAPVAGAAVVFALAGAGDHRGFDVLAAVVQATEPGAGVFHVDAEESYSGKRGVTRFQYWQTIHPRRERMLVTESYPGKATRRIERAIAPGETWHYWSSGAPASILRSRSTRHEVAVFDAAQIHQAYRRGELRLLGTTRVEGRSAYRLRVVNPEPHAPPVDILVATGTFAPIEDINYRWTRDGRLQPGWILRYRAYEELELNPANVALTRMAPHPGATLRPVPTP